MAQKVSIIIPNYNGRDLLEKNLPLVIQNSPNCEIIVVDDGSKDDSVSLIRKKFKKIKLIVQEKNHGFSFTVNNGVRNSKGELVLLLNSDTAPRAGYLKPLIEHFKNDESLFAVGISDDSHENDKIVVKGKGGAMFKDGFFLHFALPPEAGKTLWVSGGSGLFSKEKFLELNGLDTIYAPFYWEDIDLSYRAYKRGYYCLFEPKSKVDHYHEEGAIKKTRDEGYIKMISYKNQFIFVWRNISDPIYLLEHVLYFPYHFIRCAIKGEWQFFQGLIKATLQIPQLIINYDKYSKGNIRTDREILNEFKKSQHTLGSKTST